MMWKQDLEEIDLGKPQEEAFKACVGTYCSAELQECGTQPICVEEQKTILMQKEQLQPCVDGYLGESRQTCLKARETLQKNLLCWQENCYDWQGNLPEALLSVLDDCDINGDEKLSKIELYEGVVKFWKSKKGRNLEYIYEAVDKVWDDMASLDDEIEEVSDIQAHLTTTEAQASVNFRNNILSKVLKQSGASTHKTASTVRKEKREKKRKDRRKSKNKRKNRKNKSEL